MDIFKLVGSIYVDTTKANESISKTSKEAETLGSKFLNGAATAGKWALGIGAAATTAGASLLATANKASESMDRVQKGAQELGMSYQTYQELDYMLNRNGASIDDLSKGFKNISNDLADFANGTAKASETYDALGVSLKNTDGSMRSSEEVLMDTLSALSDMEDITQRNALANDIFGNSYMSLLPTLNGGSAGIKELTDKAHELGLVLGDEAIDEGAKFGDMMADVKDSFNNVITVVGTQLFPLIEELLSWILDNMPQIQSFLQEFFAILGDLLSHLMVVIQAIAPIVEEVWTNLVQPILYSVLDFISAVFTGDIEGAFNAIWNFLKSLFGGLYNLFKEPFDKFVGMLGGWVDKALQPFRSLADAIGRIWEGIKSVFKLPHFTITGSLNPLKWFDEGMPKIGVEWYAKGGIMNRPTEFGYNPYTDSKMVGGEAGPEAIAPLSTLEDYFKKWSYSSDVSDKLDELISLLALILSKNQDISIVLDDNTLVGKLVRKLNKELKRNQLDEARGI